MKTEILIAEIRAELNRMQSSRSIAAIGYKLDELRDAVADQMADAFAEGRYATLEKVVSVNALSPVGPNYL